MSPLRIIASSLSAALLLAACGADLTDYCDDRCACEGCSDREYDNCIDEAEDRERDAEREGCEAELSDYAACLNDNSTCHGHDFDVDHGDCNRERDDLNDCLR